MGASTSNKLPWVVPKQWKEDLIAGNISREMHVEMIMTSLREKMVMTFDHPSAYRRLLDIMANKTVNQGYLISNMLLWPDPLDELG